MSLLHKYFWPIRADSWKDLSNELGGTYIPGGFLRSSRVLIPSVQSVITLDTYFITYRRYRKVNRTLTRLRIPFIDLTGFRFVIYRKGLFSDIATWFGSQNKATGHAELDRQFVIKGTDEECLKSFFDSERLRRAITSQRQPRLAACVVNRPFYPHLPVHLAELRFTVEGVVEDPGRLKQYVALMAIAMAQLRHIGAASTDDPNYVF